MKTFKLCTLAVLLNDEKNDKITRIDVPLVDGLIINKEEVRKNWLLEAVIEEEWTPIFKEFLESGQKVMAEVTITRKTNDPATLVCKVRTVEKLKDHFAVHLEGVLIVIKDDISDVVLKNLIADGYSGEELYHEYKRRKKDRGQAIQGVLEHAYDQVKQKGYYDLNSDS